jgi:hypothetical protein
MSFARQILSGRRCEIAFSGLLLVSLALALFVAAPTAMAQVIADDACPADVAGRSVQCVSQDVSLASVDYEPGNLPAECVAGTEIPLDVRLGFVVNANARRYDVATWIARESGDIKLPSTSGGPTSCSLLTATQQYFSEIPDPPLPSVPNPVEGLLIVDELDGDACYDTLPAARQYFAADFPNGLTVTCLPGPGGELTFQTLVSWSTQSTATCDGTAPSFVNEISNSKCAAGSPITLPVNVLSRLVIEKQTIPDGLPDSFDFSGTATDPINGEVALTPFSLTDGSEQALTAPLDATFSITEAIPPGFALDSIVCTNQTTVQPANVTVNTATGNVSVPMSGSQFDVRCVFTNDQLPATLTVVKQANGLDDTFDFEWGSTTNTPATAFQLATASGTASTDIIIETGLGDTDFFVTETLTQAPIDAGWVAESAECAPSDDLANPIVTGTTGADGASVTGLTLNAGDDITCTFVNNAPASVTVTKIAQGGDEIFPFLTSLGNFDITTTGGNGSQGPITVPIPDSGTGVAVAILEDLSGLPKWNLDNIACSGITETVINNNVQFNLQPGNVVNCTFTNVADGQISVVKNTLGGDGTFMYTTDLPGVTDGMFSIMTTDNVGSASIANQGPGLYAVTETLQTGWDLTGISCTVTFTPNPAPLSIFIYANSITPGGTSAFEPGDDTALIDLAAGEDVSCTFTNTQRGAIVIRKETVPAGGTGFGFTQDIDGTGPFSLDDGGSATFSDILPGATYTVTEDDPAPDFVLTDITCIESEVVGDNVSTSDEGTRTATINLDPGELVTCTFTNTEQANLTITKAVTVDGPDVADFDFTSSTLPDATFSMNGVTAAVPVSTTYSNLVPGTYDVAEDEIAALANGWALVGARCNDGTNLLTNNFQVDLSAGEDVVCTFTNAPLGSATIIKSLVGVTSGDDLGADTFDFIGTAPFSGLVFGAADFVGVSASQDYTNQLDPQNNPYAIVENTPLPAGWSLTGLGCTELGGTDEFGDPANTLTTWDLATLTAEINADYNEMITCTFENTLAGTLTIRKQTAPDDFDLLFDFTSTEVDLTGSIRDYDIANEELVFSALPGTTYSTTETVPTGWQITGIACRGQIASTITYTGATTSPTDGFEPGDDTVNVELAAGENVICEFTNTQESSITIVKNVVGPGGTFNFGSTALGPFSLTPADNATAQQAFPGLLPNTYMVAETPVPMGYQLTDISCVGATNSTVLIGADNVFTPGDTGVDIDLAPGEDVTCTFENTALGSITIGKATAPTGSPEVFDFTGSVSGMLSDGQTATAMNLLPGTYTSTETVPAGWDLTEIVCDDDTSAVPSTGDVGTATATFNVEAGEDVTCSFTNVQRATVVIVKNVLNDDGGNALVGEFGITSSAGALTFDGGVVNGDTTTYTATVSDVVPSTGFSVSETPATGYTPGTWACTDDLGASVLENAGDATGALFTVNPGRTVTCAITNDDVAPTLTLIKSVTNDTGGNAAPDDFGISVGGTPVTSGATNTYDANVALAIDEVGLAGYTFVSITGDAKCPAALGGTVTLEEGEAITCTITNDDVAPTLTLIKSVTNDNGGNAGPDDFGI